MESINSLLDQLQVSEAVSAAPSSMRASGRGELVLRSHRDQAVESTSGRNPAGK
jgi:hypothetical protein